MSMEYRVEGFPFKISASNKEDAAGLFREMAPVFASVTPSDLQEIEPRRTTIRAFRIPESENQVAIVTELRVAVWDKTTEGMSYAVVCGPHHNQFIVEEETGLIIQHGKEPLPGKKVFQATAERRKSQMEHAKEVSNSDFWTIQF